MQTATKTTCRHCGAALEATGDCPHCLFQLALDVGVVERSFPRALSAPDTDRLAALMPDLEFVELIGQGGMGAVYKVRQVRLDRLAALKVLPPERAADPAFVERFFREAQALAHLAHPKIVEVYDMGQRGPYLYMLMEYIAGSTLREVIRARRLPPEEALRVVADLCEAVEYAHVSGIVHRDIKPENVLITDAGRVKLVDFGLVKLAEDSRLDAFTLTEINLRMGTPRYMAPEQMVSAGTADHRVDIYALGVLLYELLVGEPPAVNYSAPSRRAAVDGRVDRVVEKALRERPEDRYPSAGEIRRDIDHIVRTPRRRAMLLVSAALALLATAVAAMLWYRAATADPAPPPGTPIDGVEIAVVPFDTAQARAHQQRWADHLGVPVEWTNSIGMEFVLIPPGEYLRGVEETDLPPELLGTGQAGNDPMSLAVARSSWPVHRVRLTRAFYLARTETTQRQWELVMGTPTGYFRVGHPGQSRLAGPDTSNLPAENFGWANAVDFCDRLSASDGFLAPGGGYRLPTEAEWEFALRAGTTTPYWYGTVQDHTSVYEVSMATGYVRPEPVGSRLPNPFGLFDMGGNVSEYCSDWWAPHEYKRYATRCAVDPAGPEDGTPGGLTRIIRGGHFGGPTEDHASTYRMLHQPLQWINKVGFRAALPVEAVAAKLRAAENAG